MNVVAAVDGSEYSARVIEAAIEFADGGQVHAVYVAAPIVYAMPGPGMAPIAATMDYDAMSKAEAEAVWASVGPLPDNVTTETLKGQAARMIVEYAKDVNADLIVIGSRGRGAFGSLFLGSVSHGVVHAADRNVLIVR